MGRRPDPGGGWSGAGAAWAVTGTLIAGIVAWGGLGLLADLWLGFRWLFLPIGMVLGVGGGIYLVYVKYGKEDG
ncbi:MAG TPA: hypothetical protein VEA19_00960 [Actinomycetota bacterium]|nr:hypothetical protein [Actinomycetota bacterium]